MINFNIQSNTSTTSTKHAAQRYMENTNTLLVKTVCTKNIMDAITSFIIPGQTISFIFLHI